MKVFFNSEFKFGFLVKNCCSKVVLKTLYLQNCKSYDHLSVFIAKPLHLGEEGRVGTKYT